MANRLETRIAAHLAGDPDLVAIAGDRILDRDYREAGWDAAPVPVFDGDLIFLPTVMVTDGGATEPFGGPPNADQLTVYVWVMSVVADVGYDDVAAMGRLVRTRMASWQDPVTRALPRYTGRTGRVSVNDGVYDRLAFRFGSILRTMP